MSLTSILTSKEEFAKEFKNIMSLITPNSHDFKTYSEHPAFSKDYAVLAPYELKFPIEARLVGVAFDYLARFVLSRYTHTKMTARDLYCEQALNIIGESKINDKYQRHLQVIDQFYLGKATNLDFMASMVFFAQLDHIARSGEFDQKLYEALYRLPNQSIIADLKNQGNVFYKVFIQSGLVKPDSHITYNPYFGEELSIAVGGIDADICIDHVLYDLKTTKSFGYSKNYAMQIMSYYVFHLFDKLLYDKTELETHSISRIALYKARFGEVEYFDIKNISHPLLTETMINLNQHFKLGINPIRIRDLTEEMKLKGKLILDPVCA